MNIQYANEESMDNTLKNALEKEQFILYYQPKVNLTTGKIVGMEALIRWDHREKGRTSRMDFLPSAEKTGLILPIGEWLLRTACKRNKEWQDKGLPPIVIAVNVSAHQLSEKGFVQTVQKILCEVQLAPTYLELELTESMLSEVEHILPVINELKELGIRLSFDGFGTGHSPLYYLRECPIDEIKIDPLFIGGLGSNQKDLAIVKAMIAMAHQLDIEVLAEGVETNEQLLLLQELNCDKVQGCLMSEPVPAELIERRFDEIEKSTTGQDTVVDIPKYKIPGNALENARQELQDTVRRQQGMILKYIERNGKFIHTLADGELLYKIGLTPRRVIGKELSAVLSAEDAVRKSYHYARAWNGEENLSYEGKINGISYLASLRPILRENRVVEVIVSCIDITERNENEERFQKVAEYSFTGIVIYNAETVLYTNPAATRILKENMVGKTLGDVLGKNILDFAAQLEYAIELEEKNVIVEKVFQLNNGESIDVQVKLVRISYNRKPAILALFSDETDKRNAERIFEQSAKELKDVNFALNESSIVAITNRCGIIQFVNDKFCEISKYKREELIGQDHRILNSSYHSKAFFDEMWRTIARGQTWSNEIRNRTKDGEIYWVYTTIVPFLNDKGKPYQYVSIRTDITERKKVEEALHQSEKKLTFMAFHDTLTGLPNRRYYMKRLDQSLKEARDHEQKMAVLYMDMDHFKLINDTYGHDEGDEVLKEFTRVIKAQLDCDIIFARQGGDEFTMLIPNVREEEDVRQLASRIVESLQKPIGAKYQLTVSIGISYYPKDGTKKDELLRHADEALYQAKADGKNNFKVYDPRMS